MESTDAARWRSYWAAHGRELDGAVRHRRGQPYSPSVSLYELDQLPLGMDDRRALQRELCFRTGRVVPFTPEDFVRVQVQRLEEWATVVARSV